VYPKTKSRKSHLLGEFKQTSSKSHEILHF
jgi:hypothetical protein